MLPHNLKPIEYKNLRKWTFQFCYQQEMNQQFSYTEKSIEQFVQNFEIEKKLQDLFKVFVAEVFKCKPKSDMLIEKFTKNWKMNRIAKVDLSLLRIAVTELLLRTETDTAVIISEALSLAEEFSSENSFAFLNGILDSISKEIRVG